MNFAATGSPVARRELAARSALASLRALPGGVAFMRYPCKPGRHAAAPAPAPCHGAGYRRRGPCEPVCRAAIALAIPAARDVRGKGRRAAIRRVQK